jgi:hypothetical protein
LAGIDVGGIRCAFPPYVYILDRPNAGIDIALRVEADAVAPWTWLLSMRASIRIEKTGSGQACLFEELVRTSGTAPNG